MPLNPRVTDWSAQRVWVIGASSGIGEATAEVLIARGARVAVSARSLGALETRFASRAHVVELDVTDRNACRDAAAEVVSQLGGIDLVLDFAGTYREMRPWALELDAVREIIDLNLTATFNVLAACMPHFERQPRAGFAIVSSVAGYCGLPNSLAYGASKAALINLAESLWVDLRERRIAVYLVNPGFVATPLTAKNTFEMPFLIGADEAAREIVAGLERGRFEIHFPRRFTRLLKLLRLLPYRVSFPLIRRATGA